MSNLGAVNCVDSSNPGLYCNIESIDIRWMLSENNGKFAVEAGTACSRISIFSNADGVDWNENADSAATL